MKFSIVVPVYNALPFLDSCIASVQKQKITDWELILVDDGSTDGSEAVLESYAKADSRICILRQSNKGQFFARQRGIEAAKGEYILFLDSDDELVENCLSVLDMELQKKEWDIIMYTGQIILEGVTTQRTIGCIAPDAKEVSVQWLRQNLISSNDLNSLCLKMFHHKLFEGDRTDYTCFIGTHYGEDKARLLYPVSEAERILYIPDRLYRYNLRAESTMHQFEFSNIFRMLSNEMFSMLYFYMQKWEMTDKKSQENIAIYYLRNYLSVYYGLRKRCHTAQEKRKFRKISWEKHVDQRAFCYFFSQQILFKEKVKLLAARLHL